MAITNVQGYRYQQRVSKYKRRHEEMEKAFGPNWAEKYREAGRLAKEAADLVKQREHDAAVAGVAPDEEPAVVVAPNPVGAAMDPGLTGPESIVVVPVNSCPSPERMGI